MKTMRSTDGKRIFRITDEKASELYHNGDANYAPKEVWKRKVRDINKNPNDDVDHYTGPKHNKPSKAQKRQMRKTL